VARDADPLEEIFPLPSALEEKGLQPVLVGGMALFVLGSQRITKGFDFLVSLLSWGSPRSTRARMAIYLRQTRNPKSDPLLEGGEVPLELGAPGPFRQFPPRRIRFSPLSGPVGSTASPE